jgi:hypothetical protein
MRRIGLIALGALAAAALMVTPAFAVNSTLKFQVTYSPTKVGTKSKPAAVKLFTRPYYDTLAPDADAPFAWKQARIFFPKEGVFNGKSFPSCAASKLTTAAGRTSCKKAEIGKVDAKGFALGLVEPLKVQIFNLPGGKGVAMYLQGDNPVIIDHVISGILTKISGDPLYGYKLTFDVPSDLQQPAPGAWATPLDFKVTIPAKTVKKGKKKIPFIGTTGCPSSGKLSAKIETDNTDGTTTTVETTAPCKK